MIKRMISIFLCAVLIMCVPLTASGAQSRQGAESDCPFILIRGMDFGGLYYDVNTENERPAIGTIDAKGVISTLLLAGYSGLTDKSLDSAVNKIAKYARTVLDGLSCDSTGASVYNVGCKEYPLAVGNYPDFPQGDGCELGIIKRAVELYGGDNVYYFNYDWRMNPLDIADDIAVMVDRALAETGASKVNILCASMGGVMTVAYMTKYGYSKLSKVLFVSSTFCGTQVTSDLLQGNLDVGTEPLYNYAVKNIATSDESKTFFKILKTLGVFNGLSAFANGFMDKYEDVIFDDVLYDCFGHDLSLWALVQPEEYESCINYMFGDSMEENAVFIQKADELQRMMRGRDAMLKAAKNSGVDITVVSSYNSPLIPVYPGAKLNGDSNLETFYMSGRATVADYGKTLDGSSSAPAEFLSADGVIDASTCLFPESTWFIKDAPHVGGTYGTQESDFYFWIINNAGNTTVTSNPSYPRFMQADANLNLSPLS